MCCFAAQVNNLLAWIFRYISSEGKNSKGWTCTFFFNMHLRLCRFFHCEYSSEVFLVTKPKWVKEKLDSQSQKKNTVIFSSPSLSAPWGTHPAPSLTDPCLPLMASPPGQVLSSSKTSLWLFSALLFHASANHFLSCILQMIFFSPVSTALTSLPAHGLQLVVLRGSRLVQRCGVTKPCGLSTCKTGFASNIAAWLYWSSFHSLGAEVFGLKF